VRDELTGRLLQARQLLSTLPDLADRPQQAREESRPVAAAQPTSSPATTQQTTQQPAVQPQATPQRRPQPAPSESQVDQPTTQVAPAAPRSEAPAGGRLPMPPRPTPTPDASGSSTGTGATTAPAAASPTPKVQGPTTQAIDQPVEARS
jgi:hypothetical protein